MTTSIDPTTFRQVLGSFLTGVTIVTTVGSDGEYRGITANSFTSVSLDPPLVLFCIGKQSSSCEAFTEAEGFNIHILSAEQQGLARQFVRGTSEEKFANVPITTTETGAPLLSGVGAWLACRRHQVVDAGDHYILIGEVYACEAQDYRPLGFFQSQFQTFSMGDEIAQYSARPSGSVTVAWILAADDGRVVLRRNEQDELEIPKNRTGSTRLGDEYLAGMAGGLVGAEAGIDFLFSLYEAEDERLVLIYRGVLEGPVGGLAEGMELVDLEQLGSLSIAETVEQSILRRYQRERIEARFGVYSGSQAEGTLMRVEQAD
ncbi:flavin reductase family protein [Leucobacter soli]|uniref:Flavin-dependent trigonelline monooxygenase, reductase component n=1 Tax=Leucobacter soli TaxID=2812850 RepID=A0A916NHP4_9MICO|nr:flavin reductase family protein [Leucobacter soli]CAG7615671.1 Flavin-dependent trigonelline monooxygenase, reductase component [Leucobacter soli]